MDVQVRPKRQVTLPREICKQLGIEPGDRLELTLEDSVLIVRPKKTMALEALKEIQRVFARSGLTEKELLEAGKQTRKKLLRRSNARKA
jgi:AbrB family looped-hinge helix DNA binding protein